MSTESTGRIAALTGPARAEVRTFPLPEPGPGAVLLAVRRANVCGTDVHQWHYESLLLREAGLGHEFVGEIVALGEGVTTDYAGTPVALGDRVVPVYYLTCHKCPPCLRSEFNLCQNGLAEWKIPPDVAPHFRSGFATHYYVFPGQYFYKVPDEVDDASRRRRQLRAGPDAVRRRPGRHRGRRDARRPGRRRPRAVRRGGGPRTRRAGRRHRRGVRAAGAGPQVRRRRDDRPDGPPATPPTGCARCRS